ncbi:MAG: CapA family protein [Calditrichaeota bacterium]|nr:CapA family protein [Calditrichota bacterium]MCB9367121.1 CapA family protein [Calditrichota bacterium]MCB9391893.1 CapA family protein [Calditrichota bacterium]
MQRRQQTFALIVVVGLLCGSVEARRPSHQALDERSTSLSILRTDDGFSLHWYPAAELSYWAVLYGQDAAMLDLDTLAITSDTFYVHHDSEGVYPLGFFRVDPVDFAPPADSGVSLTSFEDEPDLFGVTGEDIEPFGAEYVTTDAFDGTKALRLYANTWKRLPISPYVVQASTILSVAAKLDVLGEVQAFGVADSNEVMYYILWGKEAPQSLRWNTTYEGWFPEGEWSEVLFPIGEDWFGRFGYLPRITELRFINDNDTVAVDGEVLFDYVRDVSDALPLSPVADFSWNMLPHADPDSIQVVFHAQTYDLDSPWLTHHWDFGDGAVSAIQNPTHVFAAQSRYTVTLDVTDSESNETWVSHSVVDSPLTSNRELWFSFTGDVIMGRGYENNGGIIDQWGVDTLYEPTYPWLQTADLTSVNLECPLTTATTAHPTKGIVFKSSPEQVAGLVNAGVDFATLANNHVFDYMTDGMLETMYVLDTAGIVHNGAGMNDEQARRVKFVSANGLSMAMLSFSDRTGSYNNVQPFLDAARSRPGFAMWNRSAIECTVPDAGELADFVIINTHSGSEYSLSPILQMDAFDPLGDEDMLFELVPDTLERELRQYAIDQGADLVIAHHPHIIQGFEVYEGKLIAHSLGNFIFDLTYAETMPTVILRTHFTEGVGVDTAVVHPVYINHWIPQPARGELARIILDYESEMSRRLDTWLIRAPGADSAFVVLDTATALRTAEFRYDTLALTQDENFWISDPLALPDIGYLGFSEITSGANFEIRFGRDKLCFGNMEWEGADGWLLNSADEEYNSDFVHRGEKSIRLRRSAGNPQNVVSNTEYRIKVTPLGNYSVMGFVRTENAVDAAIQAQVYNARSSGTLLSQTDVGGMQSGTADWTFRSHDLTLPGNGYYMSLRVTLSASPTGTAFGWYDDIALIEWEEWQVEPCVAPFPNDYHYVQVRSASPATTAVLRARFDELANMPAAPLSRAER